MTVAKEETIQRLKEKVESEHGEEETLLEQVEEEAVEEAPVEEEQEDEEPEQRSSSREYVVLEQGSENDIWLLVARKEASSAEGALRALGSDLNDGTTYVAVPTRNWNPVPASIKTTTTISFQ